MLLSGIYLYSSFAVFSEVKNFNVINGTVSDPWDIYFAYYVDGVITRNMPSQNTGYTLNIEKSTCTNGVIPNWDNAGWKFIGDYHNYNATDYTRTRCNLYFENTSKVASTAIGNIEVNTYTPDFSKSACDDDTCESHEKGIYETLDDDGTSYYYRGSVENNYVKFAGFYWRIIRINGNGSIRMIYDGTSIHDNGEASDDRQYGTVKFNEYADNNMYVGYMYTSGVAHGTDTNSKIKIANDSFYALKLIDYQNYLDINIGFCGDRSSLSSNSTSGTNQNSTYTRGYLRVSSSNPKLTCEYSEDNYTAKNSSKGNKALTYPIGLVTADELVFAGISGGIFDGFYQFSKSSVSNFINTKNTFWTMTPVGYYNPFTYSGTFANVFALGDNSKINDYFCYDAYGLRPVINLKSTLKFTGDGTKNNPYVPSL